MTHFSGMRLQDQDSGVTHQDTDHSPDLGTDWVRSELSSLWAAYVRSHWPQATLSLGLSPRLILYSAGSLPLN